MKLKGQRLSGVVLCVALALIACADAFGQRPGGGGPGGPGPRPNPGIGRERFPRDGFPPGDPRMPRGPRRAEEEGVSPHARRPPPPPPFGPRADLLSTEMRFGDRQVKGAPYSAQFVSENTRTLGDGTRITRKSKGAVYRDVEGRTRRELTLDSVGPVAVEGGPKQVVFVNDYVTRTHYALDVGARTGRKLPLLDPPDGAAQPAREAQENTPKIESLGRRVIEGVEAEGVRSTVVVPAGRVGNDRPLEFVTERWYSPELQVVVLSIHRDPYVGDNVYRLTNISRAEPPPTLFEAPADYTLVEGKPAKKQTKKSRE